MTPNWDRTQPLCTECWIDREGERIPVRLTESMREKETCVDCGKTTHSGIYVHIDPKEARFPSMTAK